MLLDHFHSPLKDVRPWSGFFGMWAPKIAAALNHRLPEGWIASPTVHWDIEVDVATFEETGAAASAGTSPPSVNVPIPEPTKTIGYSVTTDVVDVRIYRELGDLILAGAVEFVSPGNKDRPDTRDAFVAKCDAYLRDAVGLVIVDIVTTRRANLHSDLIRRLGQADPQDSPTYAAAYRALRRNGDCTLSIWYRPLSVGAPIPDMLMFLKDGPVIEVPLAATYEETCDDLRIPRTAGQ